MINRFICLVGFLCALLLAGCEDPAVNNPNFHLKFSLDLGEDKGQSIGTLFQIENNCQIIAGAGFQNSFETYVGNNNRVLSFFVNSETGFNRKSLGNPFPEVYRKIRLFSLHNKVYAQTIEFDNVFQFYNDETGNWEPDSSLTEELGGDFRHFQLVNNELLHFHRWDVVYGNDTIYTSPANTSFLIGIYRNGQFLLYNLGETGTPNSIVLASWQPGMTKVEIVAEFESPCPDQQADYPYCLLDYQSGFLIGTNYGNVYYASENGLEIVSERKPDDWSWQPYALIQYYNSVLIGQYPSGSLYVYDGKIEPFEPAIKPANNASANSREAQSLSYYSGSVLVGIWPWGQVQAYDQGAAVWEPVFRLFDTPTDAKILTDSGQTDAPFINTFKENRNEVYNNTWGQRVTGFATAGEYLYASTSNKGWRTPEEDKALLGAEVVAQYGAVHQITKAGQLAVEIEWKPLTVLEFVCEDQNFRIIQDGEVLAEAEMGNIGVNYVNKYLDNLVIGEGMYGQFGGIKIEQIEVPAKEETLSNNRLN